MDIRISWDTFRDKVDSDSLAVTYIDKDGNYYLFAVKDLVQLICVLDKDGENAEEFETNYKMNAVSIL